MGYTNGYIAELEVLRATGCRLRRRATGVADLSRALRPVNRKWEQIVSGALVGTPLKNLAQLKKSCGIKGYLLHSFCSWAAPSSPSKNWGGNI